MAIQNHTWVGAKDAPSPNHGGGITPKFIVMHYTAGWTAAGAIHTFKNRASKVSAQITIGIDGTVYQHVPFNVKAWHAGPSSFAGYSGLNSHSIGIEFVNPGFLKKLEGGNFMDNSGGVHAAEAVGPVIASKYPRAGSGMFYWPVYTEAQLQVATKLVEELIAEYPIIDIVTHEEIDKRGWKTDPGPAFPMNRFKRLLHDRGNDVVQYEVTASSLNLRGGPGTNFAAIGKVKRGSKVEEMDRSGDWVRVSSEAWVHSGFLRRLM